MEHLSHCAVMERCLWAGTWQLRCRSSFLMQCLLFRAEKGSWHSLLLEFTWSLSMLSLSSLAWWRVLRQLLQYHEITGHFAAEAVTWSQQHQRNTLRRVEGKTLVKFLRWATNMKRLQKKAALNSMECHQQKQPKMFLLTLLPHFIVTWLGVLVLAGAELIFLAAAFIF